MIKSMTGWLLAIVMSAAAAASDVEVRTANNGQLVMHDIPPIPERIVDDLNRYQNVRSARALDWDKNGERLYISTRFGDVAQIHRVDQPLGARHQLTFFDEPVGTVLRRPGSEQLVYTRDAGGNEFAQIFLFDPASGESRMLSDGESRNGALVFDASGEWLAFQSTRRNGRSNDVWMMRADDPQSARVVLESPDGTWWGPSDFSLDGRYLLITNYVSAADSRIHLLDLKTGELRLLAGGGDTPSTNLALTIDAKTEGFFFVSDQFGEFRELAWAPLDEPGRIERLTSDIDWDVSGGAFSSDRKRAAFLVNAGGPNELYLLDPQRKRFRKAADLPVGLIGGLQFSPRGNRLAMTLNTAQTPSDTYVLDLSRNPLRHGALTRWTASEVGGLDTSRFATPQMVSYPTFDEVDGERRQIPAFVYKPAGQGPHPVIVSIHGGPEAQSRPGFSSTYQMWVDKLGAAVVVPNVRGSAGYGKTYLSLDNGYLREDSVRDIGALLDWIAEQPDLDASRVAVFGGSYGGYMVLASAVHYSERLRAAVDIVGISNFVTFLENTQDYRRDLRRVEYGDERDPAMRAHLEKISPLSNVDAIKIPLLVVQGHNDPRVPVTEAEQIVEALREAGTPVWYMDALNEGHGYRRKENRDIYQQAVVLFFERFLL